MNKLFVGRVGRQNALAELSPVGRACFVFCDGYQRHIMSGQGPCRVHAACVVKSSNYGIGPVEIAKIRSHHRSPGKRASVYYRDKRRSTASREMTVLLIKTIPNFPVHRKYFLISKRELFCAL